MTQLAYRSLTLVLALAGAAACSQTPQEPTQDLATPQAADLRGNDSGTADLRNNDSGTADASAGDSSLWPLRPGNSAVYRTVGSSAACPAGDHTTRVEASANACGTTVVQWYSYCVAGVPNTVLYHAEGDDVKVCFNGDLQSNWALPVEEGKTWTFYGTPFVWKRVASITVPAGTFSNCWMAKATGGAYLIETTYCRGVGPVRAVQQGPQVDIDTQLVSKNY